MLNTATDSAERSAFWKMVDTNSNINRVRTAITQATRAGVYEAVVQFVIDGDIVKILADKGYDIKRDSTCTIISWGGQNECGRVVCQ